MLVRERSNAGLRSVSPRLPPWRFHLGVLATWRFPLWGSTDDEPRQRTTTNHGKAERVGQAFQPAQPACKHVRRHFPRGSPDDGRRAQADACTIAHSARPRVHDGGVCSHDGRMGPHDDPVCAHDSRMSDQDGRMSDHYGCMSDHYGRMSDHYGRMSDHYGRWSDHYSSLGDYSFLSPTTPLFCVSSALPPTSTRRTACPPSTTPFSVA